MCNIAPVLDPVTQHLFLGVIEMLLPFMSPLSRSRQTMPTIVKSVTQDLELLGNFGDIFSVASMEIINGILDVLLSPRFTMDVLYPWTYKPKLCMCQKFEIYKHVFESEPEFWVQSHIHIPNVRLQQCNISTPRATYFMFSEI
jgi:hypothetical protein